jgi:hypothetical protein
MDKEILLSYQPNYYKNSKVIENINNAYAKELTKSQEKIINTLKQFFLLDADTSLNLWEKEFGIKTNTNLSLEERRKRLLSKIRGLGTSTINQIKNICLSYVEDANVIECNEDYSFTIELISSVGYPSFIMNLLEAIEEIKPAHLRFNIKMNGLTNDDLLLKTIMLSGEEVQVFPYQITHVQSKGKLNVALGNTQNAEIINVKPKGMVV